MQANSFPPVVDKHSKLLIVGSMPGKTSLREREYYAFKQNAFWRILFNLFDTDMILNYDAKIRFLHKHRIALWDSLQYCERKSSLDADIKNEIPNDFAGLFKQYPDIKHIAFNGKSAERYYKKYIGYSSDITYYSLPSTSPANAGMRFEQKLEAWKVILPALI